MVTAVGLLEASSTSHTTALIVMLPTAKVSRLPLFGRVTSLDKENPLPTTNSFVKFVVLLKCLKVLASSVETA